MRIRGVVLAAGLGRRLRPLTRFLPKPLLPVTGMPVLGHTLAELEAFGCEAVAINLHYQGEKISARFGNRFSSMRIVYSREEELLGTLGALAPLSDFLRPAERVVVVNGDTLCAWPLRRLLKHHLKGNARATLLMSSRAAPQDFGGGIGVASGGRITTFGAERGLPEGEAQRRLVFAGAHVFSPDVVAKLDVRPADFISDHYAPMVAGGQLIDTYETSRPWHDLGTPGRYLGGARGWAQGRHQGYRVGRQPGRSGGRFWVAAEAKTDERASIKRSVIEPGCVVEPDAVVDGSLLLPGARVGSGARVRDSVIGFSVRLPAGTAVERRLVTTARADMAPGVGDSVVGGLVYSPL